MELTLDNFKELNPGNRLRFGTRTVWEVVKVVERGIVVQMFMDGSHNHLMEWNYLVTYIKEYGNTTFAAIKVC